MRTNPESERWQLDSCSNSTCQLGCGRRPRKQTKITKKTTNLKATRGEHDGVHAAAKYGRRPRSDSEYAITTPPPPPPPQPQPQPPAPLPHKTNQLYAIDGCELRQRSDASSSSTTSSSLSPSPACHHQPELATRFSSLPPALMALAALERFHSRGARHNAPRGIAVIQDVRRSLG